MKLPTAPFGILRALRHRDFAIYTAGSSVSLIGTWMQRIATGWLTWELTGSGAWLGVMAFADLCPTILFGPLGGAAADRWSRLTVTRITQALNLCQSVALFILMATGQMNIWLLCALTALGGAFAAFNQPARLALVPSLVPRADMVAALAINSIVFNTARFIGPAVAGLMIVTTGLASTFALNAATFAVFLAALSRLGEGAPAAIATTRPGLAEQLLEGIRYTSGHQGVAALFVMATIASLCSRPVAELLPGFAAAVFASGAEGLALLTSAIGIGAVAGGFWLGGRTPTQGLTRVVLGGSVVLAFATLAFTLIDGLWAALPFLAAVGFCMSCTGIASQTLIQIIVPSHVQGRVLSLYGLIVRAGPALGALVMGVASDRFGFRLPVAAGAGLAACAAIWFWLRQDKLASLLDRQDGAPPPS